MPFGDPAECSTEGPPYKLPEIDAASSPRQRPRVSTMQLPRFELDGRM
jgi:hypothetical protein